MYYTATHRTPLRSCIILSLLTALLPHSGHSLHFFLRFALSLSKPIDYVLYCVCVCVDFSTESVVCFLVCLQNGLQLEPCHIETIYHFWTLLTQTLLISNLIFQFVHSINRLLIERFYSVHIQQYRVLFGSIWFYLVLFGSIKFY